MPYTIEAPEQKPKYTIAAPEQKPGYDPESVGSDGISPGPKPEAGPGMMERLWQGMIGKDPSRTGRFGMGVADPFYGGAQIGARATLDPPPIGFTEEQQRAVDPERQAEQVRAVDAAVQQREQSYTQGREKAEGSKLGMDWMRLLGNVAGTSPLAAVGGAVAPASALGRVGMAAAIGAGAGATEPVTSGEFGAEKAKQIGFGAVGGAAGGAVGEAIGSGIAAAIARNDPAAIERSLVNKFRSVVKPGIRGRLSAPKLDAEDRQVLNTMDQIIDNKANLKLTDPYSGREITGQTPKTLRQYSEAIDQGKAATFQKYDELAKTAEASEAAAPNRHLSQFTEASRRVSVLEREVAKAEQAVTMASAKQQRAGNNVYGSAAANQARREAQQQLEKAQTALDRAQDAKSSARTKAYSVRVDLGDATRQLRSTASDGFLTDLHPEIATKLNRLARRLEREKTMTLTETQSLVADLNKDLKGFYSTGQGSIGDKLAPVASGLREKLDAAVTGATGKQYQALKDQYGAFLAIEKDVAKAFRAEANKASGGLADRFFSTLSAAELFHGLWNPEALVRAAGIKAAQEIMRKLSDPNRAIARMFQLRESTRAIGKSSVLGERSASPMSYSFAPPASFGGAAINQKPARRDSSHTVEPPPAP